MKGLLLDESYQIAQKVGQSNLSITENVILSPLPLTREKVCLETNSHGRRECEETFWEIKIHDPIRFRS